MRSWFFRVVERATLALSKSLSPTTTKTDLTLYEPLAPPVALVTLLGLGPLEIEPLIVRTNQWLGRLYRVVYLTDCPDFLPFRRQKAMFEYLPSMAEQHRHGLGAPFRAFLAERYDLLLVKWQPRRVIIYGTPFATFANPAPTGDPLPSTSSDPSPIRAARPLQVLFVADPRFEGGTSTAMAAELAAAARAGLNAGLLMTKADLLRLPFPVHPEIRATLGDGGIAMVDPAETVEADLIVIHHPMIFARPATRRLDMRAGACVLVLHHPVTNQRGDSQYDLDTVVEHCRDAFGLPVTLAPVSDVVRHTLPLALPAGSSVAADNWSNIIDPAMFPLRERATPTWPVVVGRHARPDASKWPDDPVEAMQAYPPDAERFRIRILGGGPFLEAMYGPLPRNWELSDFSYAGVADFLRTLDFYVYFHGPVWLEAFGRTILEALTTGLVVILPAAFEPLFGPAAVYATPRDVKQLIAEFVADPDRYAAQSDRARHFAVEQAAPQLFLDRLARPYGIVPSVPTQPKPPLPSQQVLFISTNGIGLGHLTQQLAIVRRLPEDLVPVFATMSLALKIAVDDGILVHFLPHHRRLGAEADRWNAVLAEELFEIIAVTRPRVIAFDGTMPFGGLLDALAQFPEILSVWVRRPMFQESHRIAMTQSHRFDAVIEPGELADDLDVGPTKADQPNVYLVPPVLHHDPSERLDRDLAREALGIHPDEIVAALQLGSGNNFDVKALRAALIAALLETPNVVVLDFVSPIGEDTQSTLPTHPRHRLVELFPAFRFSTAFDFTVSAAGYNAFHENTFGAIPAIYVPNEAEEMDVQLARATYAALRGLGLLLRREHHRYQIDEVVATMLRRDVRVAMRERCARIPWTNGATSIANFIADMARFLRADYPITDAWKAAIAPARVIANEDAEVGDDDEARFVRRRRGPKPARTRRR